MLSFSRSCSKYSQLYAQNLKNYELKPEEVKNKVSPTIFKVYSKSNATFFLLNWAIDVGNVVVEVKPSHQ